MNWTCTNPNAPRLSIWKALEKSIGGTQAIITNLKLTRLDVNRDNLAPIGLLNLRADFRLIKRIPALSKLFFAISGLSDCHQINLAATSVRLL
jgi:hypothetical protein